MNEDANKAIQVGPKYFLTWYTIKSLALVVAIGALGWYAGREYGRNGG
jgi:hypothetical protein